MTLSDQVRKVIESCGMTRYRIAQETIVSQSTLSRFMAGHAVTSDTLDALAELLGLRITTGKRRRSKGR